MQEERQKPLSETLFDFQIAKMLEERGLESTAKNIDLVRSSRREVEKYIKQLNEGRPCGEILTEIIINSVNNKK